MEEHNKLRQQSQEVINDMTGGGRPSDLHWKGRNVQRLLSCGLLRRDTVTLISYRKMEASVVTNY